MYRENVNSIIIADRLRDVYKKHNLSYKEGQAIIQETFGYIHSVWKEQDPLEPHTWDEFLIAELGSFRPYYTNPNLKRVIESELTKQQITDKQWTDYLKELQKMDS